jgi:hypothetical protein
MVNCRQIAEEELLEKYLAGRLESPLRDDFEVHILECPKCQRDLEMLEELRSGLAAKANEIRQQAGPVSRFRPLFIPTRLRAAGWAAVASVILAVTIVGVRIAGRHAQGNSAASNTNPNPTTVPAGSSTPGATQVYPEIAALPAAEQHNILEAIRNRNISYPPEVAELRGAQETLMGPSGQSAGFRVLSPVGEVVFDPRPLFHWQPLAGARNYSVAIFDSRLNLVQSSPALHTAQWRPVRPLERDQIYLWQVKAALDDGRSVISPSAPSPEAKFRVLDQARADEFERFRQAHPDAHLVLGILYARAGILETGQQELSQVPKTSNDYELARQLLRSARKRD